MNKKYRKAVIAGNWKMNMTASQIKPFVEELKAEMPKVKGCETVLCVPAPLMSHALRAARTARISIGGQDVSKYDAGAYTGEVAGAMLADLGVKYCIVGHSERREYHNEDDMLINAKVHALIKNGVIPIICVGESTEQREMDLTLEHIAYQLKTALAGVEANMVHKCIVAYEPLWAIGTGRTATAEQAQEVCEAIRLQVRKLYGARPARSMSILYGGSMNAKNCEELLAMPDIDGGLIGGASLKPVDFAKIITAASAEE